MTEEMMETEVAEEENPAPEKEQPWRSLLLTLLQLCACAVLLGAALAVKLIGGSVCGTVSTWFHDVYQNTILIDPLPTADLPRLPGGVEETSLHAFEEGVSALPQEQESR